MTRVRVPTPPTYCSACEARAPLGIFTHRASVCSVESYDPCCARVRCAILAPTGFPHNHEWSLCGNPVGGCQRTLSGSWQGSYSHCCSAQLFLTLSRLAHVQLPVLELWRNTVNSISK